MKFVYTFSISFNFFGSTAEVKKILVTDRLTRLFWPNHSAAIFLTLFPSFSWLIDDRSGEERKEKGEKAARNKKSGKNRIHDELFLCCVRAGATRGRKMTVPGIGRIEKLVFPGGNGKVTSSCAPPFPPLTPLRVIFEH